jgi:hypothetical protein
VIVDAVEHVSQISLRIKTIHLCRLNDRHGACQGFRSRVGSCEQPIPSSNANRTQSPLGGIVVDCDTAVFEEQAERGPSAQTITESCSQIAFTRNAVQLGFCPETECFSLGLALLLTSKKTDIGRLTIDASFDIVERTDTIEGFPRDLGFIGCPDIVEVTSPMRLAGCFFEARTPIRSKRVQLAISFIAVSLKDAA